MNKGNMMQFLSDFLEAWEELDGDVGDFLDHWTDELANAIRQGEFDGEDE